MNFEGLTEKEIEAELFERELQKNLFGTELYD